MKAEHVDGKFLEMFKKQKSFPVATWEPSFLMFQAEIFNVSFLDPKFFQQPALY